jgi:hypothetical protein
MNGPLLGRATRMMKEYEDRSPLLADRTLARLRQGGEQRASRLSGQIETATTRLRERFQKLGRVKDQVKRKSGETALRKETADLRQEIIEMAAITAAEAVREFADALLLSQGRLAVHAVLLREYTAGLVREIRERVGTSELFRMKSLLPWQKDPTTHGGQDFLGGTSFANCLAAALFRLPVPGPHVRRLDLDTTQRGLTIR